MNNSLHTNTNTTDKSRGSAYKYVDGLRPEVGNNINDFEQETNI